ncbi:MAG: SLC13 family permease [Lachnospiraceae bacterium]|jgi:sodium-dependent dicarboxylate transporter 2/3/5
MSSKTKKTEAQPFEALHKEPGSFFKNIDFKRLGGLLIAAVLIAFFALFPPFKGLSEEGMASIGFFLAAIVLFILQVAPLAVVSLSLMILLPFFKITTLSEIYANFGGTSFFFLLFAFGVTGAISNTTLPLRISAWVTKISKGNPKALIYGFLFASAIISGFMSNFGTLIMFYGIISMFLKSAGMKPGQTQLGKALVIGVSISSAIGGFMSPAGTPGNLITQAMLLDLGYDITFAKWFVMCTPFALLATFLVATSVIILFKPEKMPQAARQAVFDAKEKLGPMTSRETKAIIIVLITIALWFASSWVSFLNTTVVAGCAFFIMFLPGVDLMDWKTYVRETDWNMLFLVGSVAITMGCVNSTGAIAWISDKMFSGLGNMSGYIMMLVVGLFVCALRVCIPTAPSMSAIFVPIMVGIAMAVGKEYTVSLAMLPTFWSVASMSLVFTEPMFVYTHGSGYFTPGEFFKAGLGPTVILLLFTAWAFPVWFGLFGF